METQTQLPQTPPTDPNVNHNRSLIAEWERYANSLKQAFEEREKEWKKKIEVLSAEKTQFADEVNALRKEKEEREKILGEQKQQQAKERLDSVIAEMKADGRIPATNTELEKHWRSMLGQYIGTENEAAGLAIVQGLQKNPALSKPNGQQPNAPSAQAPGQNAVDVRPFTREEIGKMTTEEFMKNQTMIMKAAETGMIN